MIQLLNPLKAIPKSPENVETGGDPFAQQGKAMKFSFGTGDKPLPGFTIKRGACGFHYGNRSEFHMREPYIPAHGAPTSPRAPWSAIGSGHGPR